MQTARGIYLDLKESNFKFKYGRLVFYFSSVTYLKKFERNYTEFIKNETLKLQLRYTCILWCDEMLLLTLYKRIEKRGFRVLCDNIELDEYYRIYGLIEK